MSYKVQINPNKVPQHIAIIMDGNGRWAKQRGLKGRIFGHRNGSKAVKEVVEAATEVGVSYLTLYAFSTENWSRPRMEVNALMELLVSTLKKEINELEKNQVRLLAIGNLESLPPASYKTLMEGIEQTKHNRRLTLTLALSYSSRWEITEAVKKIAQEVAGGKLQLAQIDQKLIDNYLATKDVPDPALLIRTSGEQRISNYLLWQIAYAELYFTKTLWPDFNKEEFYKAIVDFQQRERRFGKTSEQIAK